MAIKTEINILKDLRHPNIVKYIDDIYSKQYLSIILEYVDSGALSTIIKKFGPFPENLVAIYIKQVLIGLQYLHSKNVVHRDIKGANILTTKDGLVKLADFGVAKQFSETTKSQSVVGTAYWMAPEIINIEEQTASTKPACDIWSIGVTIIELITGNPPYYDLMPTQALFRIVTDPHPELPCGISENLMDFLISCFQKEPICRFDASTALKHPWLSNIEVTIQEDDFLPCEAQLTIRSHMDSLNNLNMSLPMRFPDDDETEPEMQTIIPIRLNNTDIDINNASSPGTHRRCEALHNLLSSDKSQQDDDLLESPSNQSLEGDMTVMTSLDLDTDRQFLKAMSKQELLSSPRIFDPKINMETAILSIAEHNKHVEVPPLKMAYHGASGHQSKSTAIESNDLPASPGLSPNLDETLHMHTMWHADSSDVSEEEFQSSTRYNTARELVLVKDLQSLIEGMSIDSPKLKSNIQRLTKEMRDHPEVKPHLIGSSLRVKSILEMSNDNRLLHASLSLLNELIRDSPKIQEMICLLGVTSIVLKFVGGEWDMELRRDSGLFLTQLYAGLDNLNIVMGSGSIDAIPKLIETDSDQESHQLVRFGLDCLSRHFPGYGGCYRLWAFGSLLQRLAVLALQALDREDSILEKVAKIIGQFARLNADVKLEMCSDEILDIFMVCLDSANSEHLASFIKIFCSLSKEPTTLPHLESHGLISALVRILQTEFASHGYKIQSTAIKTLSNLCKLSPQRQEKAALAGGISAIHGCISQRKELRTIGVPLLCSFSLASEISREKLKRMGGLQMLVDLMTTDLSGKVLESISSWCSEDAVYCDQILSQKENIAKLLRVFKQVPKSMFEHTLHCYMKLIEMSDDLSYKFAHDDDFIINLIEKLGFNTGLFKQKHPNVIYIGMNMLYQLCLRHQNKRELFNRHNLYSIIVNILHESKYQEMVLLEEIASRLLQLYSK